MLYDKNKNYKSKNRDWNFEINEVTLGSAFIILEALLHENFPDRKEVWENLLNNLSSLSKKLNPLSHHPLEEIDTSNLQKEMSKILTCTNDLIVEMPWHFFPTQRNGYLPSVLTGNAWSHSYKEKRQMSIILWSGEEGLKNMLIWNPSKINRVIPDGMIVRRPSS
jgi:hypothetical protein